MGFNSSMIYTDEAGQSSLPAFAVSLTKFNGWEAVMPFGDWKQLPPTIAGKHISENYVGSLESPLQRLDSWKDNVITLNVQYRMCPPISQFISSYFCDGVLMDADDVKADHLLKKATRDVVAELGVLLERGGSELGNPDNSRRYREIGTSDSFQGKEGGIVIADYVIGDRFTFWGRTPDKENPQEVEYKHAIVTKFARDFHRLNVSLTCAKYGLFTVAQLAIFLSRKEKEAEYENTMFCMAEDARDRKIVSERV
ncbi:MAG: hypothetical protein Q9226_008879 [Calogaya cf. arnoldii]